MNLKNSLILSFLYYIIIIIIIVIIISLLNTLGWDPVTGLGAANFRKLYNYLFNLPSFSTKPFIPVGDIVAPTQTSAAEDNKDKKDQKNDRSNKDRSGDSGSSKNEVGNDKEGDNAFVPYQLDGDDNVSKDNSKDAAGWSFQHVIFILVALFVVLAAVGYVVRYRNDLCQRLSSCGVRSMGYNPGYQYSQLHSSEEDAAKEGGTGLRSDDNKHIRHYGSLGVEIQQQQPTNPQSRV